MNNTKKMILSLISVAFVNANVVDIADYFNARGVDKDGNTIFHKVAQSCHEPDRFGLEIRPMQWINQNMPREKNIVFDTMIAIGSDTDNGQQYFDNGKKILIESVTANKRVRALLEIRQKMNLMEPQQINDSIVDLLLIAKNNQGQTALDIFRDQVQNHPEAEWCFMLAVGLDIYDQIKTAEREEQKVVNSVEGAMPSQQ